MPLNCQGSQEEPEGRPGGPGDLKTAQGGLGVTLSPFTSLSSSWPSFWLFLGSLAIYQAIIILKPGQFGYRESFYYMSGCTCPMA